MKKIFVLFETDFHHSNDSKVMIGIFTNQQKLRSSITKIIKKETNENDEVPKDEKKDTIDYHVGFCLTKKQTQGLPNYELFWEECEPNTIF